MAPKRKEEKRPLRKKAKTSAARPASRVVRVAKRVAAKPAAVKRLLAKHVAAKAAAKKRLVPTSLSQAPVLKEVSDDFIPSIIVPTSSAPVLPAPSAALSWLPSVWPLRAVSALFGLALAIISVGGIVIGSVNAATYQYPTEAPPGGNVPAVIWNRTSTTGTQANASIDIDGGVAAAGMSQLGGAALPLTGSQNLLYGNILSGTANTSLLLLQNNSVDRFRVASNGDVTVAGKLTVPGCFGKTFLGLTAAAYTPNLPVNGSSGLNPNLAGYYAADRICDTAFSGSHVCQVGEMLESVQCSAASDPVRSQGGQFAWINGGPPGDAAINANDCIGWTTTSSSSFGRVWSFNNVTGGFGTLTGCNVPSGLQFACCK